MAILKRPISFRHYRNQGIFDLKANAWRNTGMPVVDKKQI